MELSVSSPGLSCLTCEDRPEQATELHRKACHPMALVHLSQSTLIAALSCCIPSAESSLGSPLDAGRVSSPGIAGRLDPGLLSSEAVRQYQNC